MGTTADLSADGRYRYTLTRCWDETKPAVLFVMLNPSTADADVDDPTIRRCIGFAKAWGHGTLLVWNLYALRATDPTWLDSADDPIGRENEDHLWRLMRRADLIVVAWGAKPNRGKYVNREKVMFWGPFWDREVVALGVTKDGHPRHPLYVRGDTTPVPFWPRGVCRPSLPASMAEAAPVAEPKPGAGRPAEREQENDAQSDFT